MCNTVSNLFQPLVLAGLVLLGAASALSIQHDEGTAEVQGTPQRVVAMDEEALGWLYALNLGPRVVGVGSSYMQPNMLEGSKLKDSTAQTGFFARGKLNQPSFVGSWEQPNLETITALHPDLIVRLTWEGNENYGALSNVAPTLGYKEGGPDFWQKAVRDLGGIFGKQERAEQIIKLPQNVNKYNGMALERAGVFERFPKVVVLAPFAGGSNWVYTSTRLIDDLRALGFEDGIELENVTLGVGAEVSEEALLGLSDDTLLVVFPPGGEYNGAGAFAKSATGKKLADRTVVYEPEAFSPYSGPLTQAHNSNQVTQKILDLVKELP